MSFEVCIMWYQSGEQVPMPFEGVRGAFGATAAPQQADGFRVISEGQEVAFVFAEPDGDGNVMSVMVSRPGGPPEFWNSIVALIKLGHGLCVWPGDAQAVAEAATLAHLPDDVKDATETQVVDDGASLMRVIEKS